jgi:hypothetical protein
LLLLATAGFLAWSWTGERRDRGERSEELPVRVASVRPTALGTEGPPPVDPDSVDRDRDLHGVVVRKADGKPVAGARITIIFEPWRRVQLRLYPRDNVQTTGPETVSAGDGSFCLPLEHARNYSLRVEKEGFAIAHWTMLRRGERTRIELEGGTLLSIRVLDPDKAPVPAARLFVLCWEDGRRQRFDVTSDAAGEVSWPRVLPTGSVSIEIEHAERGYLRTNRRWSNRSEPIVVTYPPGRTVTGRVVAAKTRLPIAGARVGHWPNLAGAVVADDQGNFRLPGWTGDRSSVLWAEAPGYATYGVRVADSDDVEIALPTGGSIVARVVDAQRRPVFGARAILQSVNRLGRDSIVQERRSVSDDDGRIRFDGIGAHMGPLFGGHTLHVHAPGHARLVRKVPAFHAAEPKDLGDLQLAEPHSVRVTVLRGDEPVVRVRTWLQGPIDPAAQPGEMPASEHAMTDDLGRIHFGDLAPGQYRFPVRLGNAPGVDELFDLVERAQELELKLPETRRVNVTVVDESGAPTHQFLRLSAGHERVSVSAQVGADGSATLHLTPEMRHVWLRDFRNRRPGGGQKFEVGPEQSELRIVHTSKTPIRGVAVNEQGDPVDRPRLRAFRDGKEIGGTTGNRKGEFVLNVDAGKPCRVEVHGGYVRKENTINFLVGLNDSVAPGTRDLRIVVREQARDRSLRIRALDPDGRMVSGVLVGRNNGLSSSGKTDESGVRTVSELGATTAAFGGFDPLGRFAHPEPIVTSPQGQTIELRFRRGKRFRVRLMDKDKPVVDSPCFVSAPELSANFRTDGEGWVVLVSPEGTDDRFQISVRRDRRQLNVFAKRADDGQSFDIRAVPNR